MLAASPMRAANRSETSTLLAPQTAAAKVSLVRVDRRTGRLVRAIAGGEPAAAIRITPPPAHIQLLIEQSARAHNVDPLLVQSVIQVESNYNHYAVSPKGAEGLMQLMPRTARTLGPATLSIPRRTSKRASNTCNICKVFSRTTGSLSRLTMRVPRQSKSTSGSRPMRKPRTM